MRRNRLFASLVVVPLASLLLASLLLAPPASARRVIAPPGNAGVGQYVEVVPGAGGSTPVGTHSSNGPVLSPAERRRLEAQGGSGKALASFVQRTGVAKGKGSSSAHAHGAHGQGTGAAHGQGAGGSGNGSSGGSLPGAVPTSAAKPASGGLGWGLPVALLAIALGAAGIAMARRRTA